MLLRKDRLDDPHAIDVEELFCRILSIDFEGMGPLFVQIFEMTTAKHFLVVKRPS